MSNFVPGNYDLRAALIFCYHLKKTVAESHRMLVEAYGVHALGKSQCFEWFKKFRSGNFDARNEERGRRPKKFQDSELQASLDEDDAQTQQQLAYRLNVTREAVSIRLKAMGKIEKVGKWVPHEPNDRQQENRKTTCEMLLARYKRKSFLHRIVTCQGNDWSVQLRNIFARGLLTRLGSVRLLFICIGGTRTFWPALHFLRKCTKMARWLVCLKRATVFLAWHPPIARQVGKMYS